MELTLKELAMRCKVSADRFNRALADLKDIPDSWMQKEAYLLMKRSYALYTHLMNANAPDEVELRCSKCKELKTLLELRTGGIDSAVVCVDCQP